jgi:hypothetical protein
VKGSPTRTRKNGMGNSRSPTLCSAFFRFLYWATGAALRFSPDFQAFRSSAFALGACLQIDPLSRKRSMGAADVTSLPRWCARGGFSFLYRFCVLCLNMVSSQTAARECHAGSPC